MPADVLGAYKSNVMFLPECLGDLQDLCVVQSLDFGGEESEFSITGIIQGK